MRNLKKQGFLWMAVFTLCTASAVPALAAPASPESVTNNPDRQKLQIPAGICGFSPRLAKKQISRKVD